VLAAEKLADDGVAREQVAAVVDARDLSAERDGDVLGLDRPREEAEAQLGTLLHPLYLRPYHNTHR
jgi:hypothetical protein